MKRMGMLVLGIVIWLSAVAGSAQTVSDEERFQPGDAVRIQFWQLWTESKSPGTPMGNISGDYVIDPEGYIFLPFVGKMRVAGLTPTELIERLGERYSAFVERPFIHVRPLIRVSVMGAVFRPGSYRIDPSSSLWELLELAGGVRNEADLNKIFVQRGGRKVIENLLSAFENAYSLKSVGIRSGDQIVVPAKRPFFLARMVGFLNLGISIALLYIRLSDRMR
jgi:polysaccharide export outer membrane protein